LWKIHKALVFRISWLNVTFTQAMRTGTPQNLEQNLALLAQSRSQWKVTRGRKERKNQNGRPSLYLGEDSQQGAFAFG
jgi:hypothetical protein